MSRNNLSILVVSGLAAALLVTLPVRLQGGSDKTAARQGYLGVELRSLTPELREQLEVPAGSGVLIAAVEEEGPAAAAGILVGDVVTAFDRLPISTPGDLGREVRHRPGDAVVIEVFRDGVPLDLPVVLGERPAGDRQAAHPHPGDDWMAWAEHWQRFGEEMGERWGRWGEQFGERFGEEFGERFGRDFGEHWGRWGEQFGRRWGERGELSDEQLQELDRELERAFAEIDLEQIGAAVEEAMKALDSIDWQQMELEIQRSLERMEESLERSFEKLERHEGSA